VLTGVALGGPAYAFHLWRVGQCHLAVIAASVAAIAMTMHLRHALVAQTTQYADALTAVSVLLGVPGQTLSTWDLDYRTLVVTAASVGSLMAWVDVHSARATAE
jgi:hypothetical protein